MKDQEKDMIFITRFFDLDLSRDELNAFEKRIANDIAFRQKVEAYEEADTLVHKKYVTDEKLARSDKWTNLSNRHMNPETSAAIPWKWIGGIAASFIILFSIWQVNTLSQKPDMNQLLADSWNKKVGLDFNAIRSTTKDSLKQVILDAFKAYDKEDYQSTIDLLNNYKTTVYYEDALLLKGLSYYKNGDTAIALQTLDTLSLYPTGKKSEVAKWYQGLIHLEGGNTEIAKQFIDISANKIKLKE